MKLPILYKRDKKGVLRYREIEVEGNIIRTRSGVYKNRDSHEWKEKVRECQYYEGHGSYKSGEEVARLEAESTWKRLKRKEAMEEDMNMAMEDGYKFPIIPVELQRYNELKDTHSLVDGRYLVQAKLDGQRCTTHYKDGSVRFFSRTRKEIPYIDHIRSVMKKIYEKIPKLQSYVFDGELIDPTGTRNTGRSAMSTKDKHPNNDKMILYIFGIVTDVDDPLHMRWSLLTKLMSKVNVECVRLVPTYGEVDINDHEQIDIYLHQAIETRYEGITLYHLDMVYPVCKDRSKYCLKVKPRDDEEAIIVGAHEGTDEHEGLIIFEVDNGSSIQYITPRWSHNERRRAMERYRDDPSLYKDRYLTISYRCKNEYGNYVEAVGECIRDPDT